MPFESKSQQRKMFAMEARGELDKGTARRWAHKTPNIKSLPEKKAYDLGRALAMHETGLAKEAAMPPWSEVWSGIKSMAGGARGKTIELMKARRLREALANLGKVSDDVLLTPEGKAKFVGREGIQTNLPGFGLKEEFAGMSPRHLVYKDILNSMRPYGIAAGAGTAAALTPSALRGIFPGLQE